MTSMNTPSLDLAAIGNCTIASLITPKGAHVWHCFPRLDGDPVFNALLGGPSPDAGFFDIALNNFAASEQRYVPNTAILETVLRDSGGQSLRVLDFAPRYRRYGRMFRPPMIVRRIEPIAGRPLVALRLRPTFGYGSRSPRITLGSNHVRFVADDQVLRMTTDMPVSYALHETQFALDRPVNVFLGDDETLPENPDSLARTFLAETTSYWQDWVRDLNVPFDWQEAVIRAAITLKLCSFDDTGAIVAALTTSVPEVAGSARNWDYRFCWLRDAFFTVTALNRLSATRTMEAFVRFVLDAMQRDANAPISPLLAVAPGTDPTERIAEALPGYRGIGPVRIGNAAVIQRQNDVYGSIVLTAAQMFWDQRLPLQGDASLYRQLCEVGHLAASAALEPDAGLWEYRNRTRVHTFSAAMCWAALHRLGHIARRIGIEQEAEAWLDQAANLRSAILDRSTVAGGGWISGTLDGAVADASTLVLPEIGFISSRDERYLRTLEIVEKRLVRSGFVMRYDEADDFGIPENAFLLCTFWYIDALARVGRRQEARAHFESALSCCNHVGLLSEHVDPKTRELWGNFPQTYSQVGLILSATRLSRSWEEGLWHAS
jgi:GH15 family glucan-1,4-alpha-glucosidase